MLTRKKLCNGYCCFLDEKDGHEGVLQRKANGLLEMSEDAINKLKTVSEMAEIDIDNYEEYEQAIVIILSSY